jgi:hypothetical protein
VECESEAFATRLTDVIRQREQELKAQLGDFVLSQDQKEPDGSWDSTCPVWTYVPGNVDPEAIVKGMICYRDALSGHLDQITPRLADELAAFQRYYEMAEPVLAREVFNAADGWKAYRTVKNRGFGFYRWAKAGFFTGFDSPAGLTDYGLKAIEGDLFPKIIGVYCHTKAIATQLTKLMRENQNQVKARVGDFVLSADHESDGWWDYESPVWTYVPGKEDIPALVKRMTGFRDALTGYLDQVTPRLQK